MKFGLLLIASGMMAFAGGAWGQDKAKEPTVLPDKAPEKAPENAAPNEKPPEIPAGLESKARAGTFWIAASGRVEGKDVQSSGVGFLVGDDGLGVVMMDAVLGMTDVRATFSGQGTKGVSVQVLACDPGEGIALVKVDMNAVAKRGNLAPLELATEDVKEGAELFNVTAPQKGTVKIVSGRVASRTTLAELPDKVQTALDFPNKSTWLTTSGSMGSLIAATPTLGADGKVVGMCIAKLKNGERGSLIRSVDAIAALVKRGSGEKTTWKELASESIIESTPNSLKPLWMKPQAGFSPVSALNQAVTNLERNCFCARCRGQGEVQEQEITKPSKITEPGRRPGLGIEPAEVRTVTKPCTLCEQTGYASGDDLYRDAGKVLRAIPKVPSDEVKRGAAMDRARLAFGRMAAWKMRQLGRAVNSKAMTALGGDPREGDVIMLVGFVTNIRQENGKEVVDVVVDFDINLVLDAVVKMRVEVVGPELRDASVNDAVFVASILESRHTRNGVNTGILKGGAVFAARKDHLRE